MKKYVDEGKIGVASGIAPLNSSVKIDSIYLPNYTDVNYVASNEIADLTAKQTWLSEQTYNYDDYGLALTDTINGVAAGFKAPRGLFNQLFVDDIVFTRNSTENSGECGEEIGVYIWTDVETKSAIRDSAGNITTEGYNNLLNYTKVAAITKDGGLVLKSSTPNSNKHFKITVNDNGQISATEV